MKVEIIETKKEFQPVTIQITLEKESEFNAMYSLLGKSSRDLHQLSDGAYNTRVHSYSDIRELSNLIFKELSNSIK